MTVLDLSRAATGGLTSRRIPPSPSQSLSRAERRRQQRASAEADRRVVRRAQLLAVAALLRSAEEVVAAGWLQNAWFGYVGPDGRARVVTAAGAGRLGDRPVTAACLVGAVVAAGGGPTAATSPPVHRALEVVWHARFRRADDPDGLDWTPAPTIHLARVRDLTRWNDTPGRTVTEVRGLLEVAVARTDAELRQPAAAGYLGGR